jgi:hypothetical protein
MADERDQKPPVAPLPPRSPGAREARLAAALRDNLRRRKAQARGRRRVVDDGDERKD